VPAYIGPELWSDQRHVCKMLRIHSNDVNSMFLATPEMQSIFIVRLTSVVHEPSSIQITLNKVCLPKIGMSTAGAGSKNPKQHRCNLCGRVFDSAELLEAHKRMDHGKNSLPPAGVG
jgi:C2H2 type zinc finger protein